MTTYPDMTTYPETYASLPRESWALIANGSRELAVFKDSDGRVTRLWDGSFIDGLVQNSRFRVVTHAEAVASAKALRKAFS